MGCYPHARDARLDDGRDGEVIPRCASMPDLFDSGKYFFAPNLNDFRSVEAVGFLIYHFGVSFGWFYSIDSRDLMQVSVMW